MLDNAAHLNHHRSQRTVRNAQNMFLKLHFSDIEAHGVAEAAPLCTVAAAAAVLYAIQEKSSPFMPIKPPAILTAFRHSYRMVGWDMFR